MGNKLKVIGITGGFGSGKSTAASFFESKGYRKITLSQFLEEEVGKRGLLITRKNLQDIGNEWREKFGSGILAKKALEFALNSKARKVVIDGIRNTGEIRELEKEEFVLVAIEASEKIRFERLKNLKRREKLTWELFQKLDDRDMGEENSDAGLQLRRCMEMADTRVKNEGSLEEFEKKLGELAI